MDIQFTREQLVEATPESVSEGLKNKHAFIGGAGGLGSNVALMLVRAGIGKLTIVDFDEVAPSNINRQFYFHDQIGRSKVEALKENLNRINPYTEINVLAERITPENIGGMLDKDSVDMVFECFDVPQAKAMIVNYMLTERPDTPVVAVSGLSGYSPVNSITAKKGPAKLYLIGDSKSEASEEGTLATRVTFASSMQAHVGLRLMIGEEPF